MLQVVLVELVISRVYYCITTGILSFARHRHVPTLWRMNQFFDGFISFQNSNSNRWWTRESFRFKDSTTVGGHRLHDPRPDFLSSVETRELFRSVLEAGATTRAVQSEASSILSGINSIFITLDS